MSIAAGFVLTQVRIVDALGERRVDTLVVADGHILHVGPEDPAFAELPRVDASGLTVVPGLVDAHTHLSLTPGGAFLDLSREAELELWGRHLAAYVACGVAAVLDTGVVPADAVALNELAAAGPSPILRYLGPLVSPVGGYVSAVLPQFPGIGTAAELEARLQEFDALDPIGVKVTMEDGFVRPIWPWQSDEVMAALVAQPRPIFVHALEPEEYERALPLHPRAFVHPPHDPDEALVAALGDTPVVTTLAVVDSMLTAVEPERLEDPLVRLVVPEIERRAAADPDTIHRSARAIADVMLPKMPGFVRSVAASQVVNRRTIERRSTAELEEARWLHEHGVALVAGSDSGNWPLFLFEFHGPTTIRELELLQEAGIPPADVLRIGTLEGAKLLGLEAELGTVEVGKRASFVVVTGDPLVDVGALREARWVVMDGERRTPAEWLAPVGP